MQHFRCPVCHRLVPRADGDTSGFVCRWSDCAPITSDKEKELARLAKLQPKTGHREHVVYYILWAGRIKIGTTTNLQQRLRTLYHDEILAVEPGGYATETMRHRQFSHLLVPGQSEWFTDAPELRAHIADLTSESGARSA